MHNFQPILIAIGILAIVGVLIHGFLVSKKDQESIDPETYDDFEEEAIKVHKEPYATTMVENDTEAMDFYGVSSEEKDEIEAFDLLPSDENVIEDNYSEIDISDTLRETQAATLLTEVKATQKEFDNEQIINNEVDYSLFENEQLNESETKDKLVLVQEVVNDPDQTCSIEEPTDIFVFNVVARDGSKLGGHELLQFFLTSGFRYGHMNIFHRHENSDGTGEVLFSIANMMAPGTFDLDSMEQFQSQGISFFLTAPNDNIDIKKAFDLMLRAVVQIADEFHCDVLNEQRGTLTEAQFIEYRSRLLQYT